MTAAADESVVVGLENPLEVTNDASQTVNCGYAGGCHRVIEA